MPEITEQERNLDKQATLNTKLQAMRVGGKMEVDINGRRERAELFCVERQTNPLTLRFTLMYYGVATGKELIASNALNKWEFKS